MATGDKYEGEWLAGKKNGSGINTLMQVCTYSQMETYMKANFRTETGKEKDHILGPTIAFTEENGWPTK